jgi:hypothetical protein
MSDSKGVVSRKIRQAAATEEKLRRKNQKKSKGWVAAKKRSKVNLGVVRTAAILGVVSRMIRQAAATEEKLKRIKSEEKQRLCSSEGQAKKPGSRKAERWANISDSDKEEKQGTEEVKGSSELELGSVLERSKLGWERRKSQSTTFSNLKEDSENVKRGEEVFATQEGTAQQEDEDPYAGIRRRLEAEELEKAQQKYTGSS